MESALSDLTALVLETQATGNASFAAEFEKKYSERGDDHEIDAFKLSYEGVPVDVRFVYGK